jgi:hypothetical protein
MTRDGRSPFDGFFHVGPAVVYAACIFYGGSVPMPAGPPAGMSDKALHAIAFGVFVPVLLVAVRYVAARPLPLALSASVALSSATGMLLEIWQLFCPTRTFEVLDWVADTAGAVLVGLVMFAFLTASRRARPSPGQAPPGV